MKIAQNSYLMWFLLGLGAILAPEGTAQITNYSVAGQGIYFDPNSGNFVLGFPLDVIGSNYWSRNSTWNRAVGAVEFDLTGLPIGEHILHLPDTAEAPGFDPSVPNLSNLYGYVGDGTITVGDRLLSDVFLKTVETSKPSHHDADVDVSAFVNSHIISQHRFLGFLLTPRNAFTLEQFGFGGTFSWRQPQVALISTPKPFMSISNNPASDEVEIRSWTSETNTCYQLQETFRLEMDQWMNRGDPVSGSNHLQQIIWTIQRSLTLRAGFFRIVVTNCVER